jgi:hypothetical protein
LAGFLGFFFIWQVLVDKNLAMDSSWGAPTILKVSHKSVERFGRSRFGFRGVDPWVLFIWAAQAWPVWPVCVTGLTGVGYLWDLPRVNCLTRVALGLGVVGQFLVCLKLFCYALCRVFLPCILCFGSVFVPRPREVTEALWKTCCAAAVAIGLTGPVHRSDRCHRTGSKLCKFPLCVLVCFGSEGYSLVPRSSSTSVAAWAWPTWVVSQRRVLEAVFVLLESWKSCLSCWNPHLLQEEFLSAPIHSPLSGSPYRSFKYYNFR